MLSIGSKEARLLVVEKGRATKMTTPPKIEQ
jgi:hypothetical protein